MQIVLSAFYGLCLVWAVMFALVAFLCLRDSARRRRIHRRHLRCRRCEHFPKPGQTFTRANCADCPNLHR